ncbi:hypothetical protein [Embleya sp. NBC_00896]|uniref:hypothetical protein n=1 Tax=Embleya sp. NBC_00896 TaxID=2975961 RepID=UPI00386962E8|nr:hypothetical protein OG928_07500 [Embleya sp. NBC_00896]
MRFDNDEPIFKRRRWGNPRYTYNPNNPIGLALIIGSLTVGAVVMILMHTRSGPFAPPDDTSYSPRPAATWNVLPTYPTFSRAPTPTPTKLTP